MKTVENIIIGLLFSGAALLLVYTAMGWLDSY